MALKVPTLYKFLIIGTILIIIYYVYSVCAKAKRSANASAKEPFIIGESIFDKALDRLNPLAASQNPLTNQAVITGISEGDGITSRLMNQMALNIPTVSLSYESGPNGWTVLPAQCNKANTYVEPSPTQCSASGMRQKYLYQSDAGGACIQQAAGDPECDSTCPGANTQGGCNYHACDKTGQVPFSEVTDISQCDALGNRQAYAWASSASGSCIQDISGAPHCDPIRCPGANTLNGCAYCDTDASTKPTCPGYITPYTCTRPDNPPADTCTNYKRRPVSWTNAKATATNAAECTAVTYGTAVCDASCNPPQQSTDASGCGYVPYTCTRADAPPVDSCSSYKRRPVSWTNPNKATITNAAECTAVTYGTAVCSSSCNPPQQSTDPNGCNYSCPSTQSGCPGYVASCPSTTPGCPGYVAPLAPPTPSGLSISTDWANGTVTVTWNAATVTSNPELNVNKYEYSLAGPGIVAVQRNLPGNATSVTASGLIKTSELYPGTAQQGGIFYLWAMNSLGKYGANAFINVTP